MVRFHWHVEQGLSAFVVGPQTCHDLNDTNKVFEIPTHIELAGQKDAFEGVVTIRSEYLNTGEMQPVGVVLAHDTAADTWKGKLLSRLALDLAKEGACICGNDSYRSLSKHASMYMVTAELPFHHNLVVQRGHACIMGSCMQAL